MLRIYQCRSSEAARTYFTRGLSRNDYYTQQDGQERDGIWRGRGAERLGLSGLVDREGFHALCDNQHPPTPLALALRSGTDKGSNSGGSLTIRNKSNRTIGYDFNWHAPKSVSVLQALGDDKRIEEAFQESVHWTMRELEREMLTRVRINGQNFDRETGNLVWGEFLHTTARPVDGTPDMHLHSHCFVFNATYDDFEHAWKAGQFRDLKRDAPFYEAVFHARLARKLEDLGYEVRRHGKHWEIDGVPDSVIRKFSKRTLEIEKLAVEKGIKSPEAKARLGATSRKLKRKDLSQDALAGEWESRLTLPERDALTQVALDREARSRGLGTSGNSKDKHRMKITAEIAVEHALGKLLERRSTIPEKRLAEAALRHGVGWITIDEVWTEIESRPDLLRKRAEGQVYVTTKAVLEEEREMLSFASRTRGSLLPMGTGYGLFPGIPYLTKHKERLSGLSDDQRAAIHHVLTSYDRVIAVSGGAGTGKTTLLKETANALQETHHMVWAFAPTADASRGVLRREGFEKADTVARLLSDNTLQQMMRKNVIWIDEAGLLSVKDMRAIFEVARKVDARVVLSGDPRQHTAAERGDAMRLLANYAGIQPVEVRQIHRQRERYRDAVHALSNDEIEKGYGILMEMGAVYEIEDLEAMREALAKDYLQAVADKKTALVVAPTHAEGREVTELIRQGLREAGGLKGQDREIGRLQDLRWTEADRADPYLYKEGMVAVFHQNAPGFTRGEKLRVLAESTQDGRVLAEDASGKKHPLPLDHAERFGVFEQTKLDLAVGDKVRLTRNGQTKDKKHALNNGAVYSVSKFNRNGDIVLDNGWTVSKDYGHLAHGYCSTSHASQGKTVDRVLLAQPESTFVASSREGFYVSVSRGRESVRIYTDSKEGLGEAIQRTEKRLSATELSEKRNANITDRLRHIDRHERHRAMLDRANQRQRERIKPGYDHNKVPFVDEHARKQHELKKAMERKRKGPGYER